MSKEDKTKLDGLPAITFEKGRGSVMTTDIVQLKEKKENQSILKTHTAAIDGLESYIKK